MERIFSGLGCFGLVLLAILFALGVTEAIKYVSALERALVLTAAVLAAFLVAFVREFLLLFELSADEGIAHYFAEGVLYFWIRPDDLAERRFDRVEFSSTAY